LKVAILAAFHQRRKESLWYLQEIRDKLNLNRASVRFIHKFSKKSGFRTSRFGRRYLADLPIFDLPDSLILSW